MLDSFTNDPPVFRHLIFPSLWWKDLVASKEGAEIYACVSKRDVTDSGLCLIDFEFHASFDEPSEALQRPLRRSLGFA